VATRDTEPKIEALRGELESADREIVHAISRRQRLIETLAAAKREAGVALRDRTQETAVLERAETSARQLGVDAFLVSRVFRELIAHAVRVQEARAAERSTDTGVTIRVGYQGAEGAYSHWAARHHFSFHRASATFVALPTFKGLMQAVLDGVVEYGVLPIENSTAGSINETYDLLSTMDLSIVGEEIVTIEHCLIGLEPRAVQTIQRIYSHPQALAQCSQFLATLPQCEAVPFANTALAVEKVRQDGDPAQAAIGSEEAAIANQLVVLARGVANERVNLTRFVVVAQEPIEVGPGIPCKVSCIIITRHEQGRLLHCLNALAERGLNMTKIESRPRPGSPWEYQFYVDFEGNATDPAVQDALNEMQRRALDVRVLGSYPSRTTPAARIERIPAGGGR
jgi:chorismate mutase / prephenate dehydratase